MTTAWTPTQWCRMDAGAVSSPPLTPPQSLKPIDPLIEKLLRVRGVTSAEQAGRFLRPRLSHLHDPADLPGCDRAAQRLKHAVEAGQPVAIYGDYDVDGVTASAILYHTLKLAGASVTTYVPHRLDEGYGLNEQAIRKLAEDHPVIVSVDCGVTATGPAQAAKELGIDLIITDHHQFDADQLPQAYALVHPGLTGHDGQGSSNPDLCGAGVAYKLAWHFARVYTGAGVEGKLPERYRELMLDLLALAALGTVADVVPLTGENRVITAFGLRRLRHTQIDGLRELIKASKLEGEDIDAYHIGFVLGPKLNACGRMGHAREAVELLTTATGDRARELAKQLHHANEDRKATERATVRQAEQMVVEAGFDSDDQRAIVLAHRDWHPGVVGIVASRLVDKFHRPVVVLCIDEQAGEAKGSARSVDGACIHTALNACAKHLTKFGGHAMAAGMTLPIEAIDPFRDALVKQVNTMLSPAQLVGRVRIDADVALGDCNLPLFQQFQALAPFGRSNPKPRLIAERLVLSRPAQRMGSAGKHLSLYLSGATEQGAAAMRAVGWNKGDLADELPAGACVDVVFQPSINQWRGNCSAELHIIDIRLSTSEPL
ncbi:MAG: single-stranded-DNA-specific exonuclease RecJ [Planctomycetota bacterium]